MQLGDLLGILAKRRWLLVGVIGLTILISAVIGFARPAQYEATATIAITPEVRQGEGLVASDSIAALLGTYAETAKAKVNLRRAEGLIGRPLPGEVDTSTEPGTGILRISGRSEDPDDAALTARTAARAFTGSIDRNGLVSARLVDPAEAPDSPVQPRPPLIIATAALLGTLAAVLLALAMERLRRRVETPEDVAEFTQAPVLGRLPRSRVLQRGSARLIWRDEGMIDLQEAFRGLRTNIQFLLEDTNPLIQVTSPEPSQGKSTLVANLGVALAQVGIATVIVDADLRRPRQHEIFGLANLQGVSTMLAARDSELYPESSGHDSLWVLTSGPTPPEPTEMLAVRAGALAERLRSLNALVLIDGPPLLAVNDARLIAPHTDGVLMTLAARRSKPSAVEAAFQRLDLVGARTLGVVLNESDEGTKTVGYYQRGPLVTG